MSSVVPLNLGLGGLWPTPRGLVLGPRPSTAPRPKTPHVSPHISPHVSPLTPGEGRAVRVSRQTSLQSVDSAASPPSTPSTPDQALSPGQTDERLPPRLEEVRSAFRALDQSGSGRVTQGEFRRVLETSLLPPLPQTQLSGLLAQVCVRGGGPVDYMDFLRKYSRAGSAQTHSNSRRSFSGRYSSCMTLIEIQQRLKQKIGGNRGNLKSVTRAFRLFDYDRDGLIQQRDFRRVLDSCCFPLTHREFQRLWCHCSPNNTGTVSYKTFLEKLGVHPDKNQTAVPDSTKIVLGCVGTPPERTRHRNRPASHNAPGGPAHLHGLTAEQLQSLFLEKMRASLPSVRLALQAFDVSQSGRVSQEDLRAVLSSFLFPMSLSAFHRLTSCYGVRAVGAVRWELFLSHFTAPVLEPDPAPPQTDRPPDWLSLGEGHLSLGEVYPLLQKLFHHLERGGAGRIARADLRRALEAPQPWLSGPRGPPPPPGSGRSEGPRLSPAQLRELLILLDPEHTGAITRASLEQLHPTRGRSDPGETAGQAAPPTRASTGEETDSPAGTYRNPNTAERPDSHSQNAVVSDGPGSGPSPRGPEGACPRARAVEDLVFRRLREGMDRRGVALDDRLRTTARSSDGSVTETDLRKLLDDSWITLDEARFCELTASLGFIDRRISRSAFLAKYEENMARDTAQASEGSVGVGRAKPRLLTAEDCLKMIKDRIKNIHGDVLSAFRLMDRNCDGVVDAHDFRDLYDGLGLVAKEREYRRLLHLIGLRPGANLNYTEFLSVVQSGEPRGPQVQPANGPDQIHDQLASDACRRWSDMSKVLCRFDDDGQGLIFKKDLRALLFTYGLPIRPGEFEDLWSRYDAEGRGLLTATEFLEKLGVDAEEAGPRKSVAFLTPERNAVAQGLPAGATAGDLERVVLFHFSALSRELSRMDQRKEGLVSLEDLGGLLRRYRLSLDTEQLRDLLHTLNIPIDGENRELVYYDFLKAFLRDTREVGGSRPPGPPGPPERPERPVQESLDALSPENALRRMRELVTANTDALRKAFSAFDRAGSGTVGALAFRRVLDQFCGRLSDPQFRHLLTRVQLSWQEGAVYWGAFLQQFSLTHAQGESECDQTPVTQLESVESQKSFIGGEGDAEKTPKNTLSPPPAPPTDTTPPPPRPKTAPATRASPPGAGPRIKRPASVGGRGRGEPPVNRGGGGAEEEEEEEEGEGGLRAAVRRRWREIQRRCREEADPRGGGEIHTRHFLDILQALDISVTSDDLRRLGTTLDPEGGGGGGSSVSYPHFLRHFLLALEPPAARRRAFERPKLPLPAASTEGLLSRGCVEALLRIYDAVRLSWKPVRRNFIIFDRNRSGKISVQDFRKVLSQFSVRLSEEELFHLASFFDRSASGKISYDHFLGAFLR